MSTWLIAGGAGYIGSHVTRALLRQGMNVVVLDDLSTGLRKRIPDGIPMFQVSISDIPAVRQIIHDYDVTGLILLAGRKQARESCRYPLEYWRSNVSQTIDLLTAIQDSTIRHILFSSTCAIYGNAEAITEESIERPINPYGHTKLAAERILESFAVAHGVQYLAIRYFNVIGNDAFPGAHDHAEQSLLPSSMQRISRGKLPIVLGDRHSTPDGSCLRDYVDVRDIAAGHLYAAQLLETSKPCVTAVNLGSGNPVSVKELLSELCDQLGIPRKFEIAPADPADPSAIWANNLLAREILEWEPTYSTAQSVTAFIAATRAETDPSFPMADESLMQVHGSQNGKETP